MKTTIDIADPLLDAARKKAMREGTTLRALVERGLRRVVTEKEPRKHFKLKIVTYKGDGLTPEFEEAGWDKIRDAIYEDDRK
jgi:hypothetical protein